MGRVAWVLVVGLVGSPGCDPGETGGRDEPRSGSAMRVEVDLAPARPESDERPARRGRIVGPMGVEALGPVLEVVTSPDGRTIAVLDQAGVLRVRAEPTRGVVAGVEPGVRSCDDGRLVFARRLDDAAFPPSLELMVWDDGEEATPIAWDEQLDRVVTLTPDCAFAIVVVREGGLPIVLAVDLRGTTASPRTIALANRDLPRTPGKRPPGFVPVPDLETPVTWTDARTMRWTVLEESVALTIPGDEQ